MTDEKEIRKKMKAIDLTERFKKLVKYRVSTGIIALDIITNGGIPSGRLTEFFGGESTAKSRLVAHIIAEIQRVGGIAVLNDTEKALDQGLVDLTGVNMDALIYPDPEEITSVEDIFKSLEDTINIVKPQYPDKPVAFIWDSVAATPGQKELEEEIGRPEASMLRAKLIGSGLKKYLPAVYKNQITLIFVNQIQDRMNVMFGDQTTTPGGRQIKFLASLRLGMKIIGAIKDDQTKEQIGTTIQMLVKKSKVGPPFGIVNFEMPAFDSIDKYAGLMDYMRRHEEVIHLGAGRYQFVGENEPEWKKDDFSIAYEGWKKRTEKEKT